MMKNFICCIFVIAINESGYITLRLSFLNGTLHLKQNLSILNIVKWFVKQTNSQNSLDQSEASITVTWPLWTNHSRPTDKNLLLLETFLAPTGAQEMLIFVHLFIWFKFV